MMSKKRLHKVARKGCIKQGSVPKLTSKEKAVLSLLCDEFLTPQQVAIRRRISHQAVYKIIKNLKKKGAMNPTYEKVAKTRPTMQPCNHIRLHGQEFNVRILFKDSRYQSRLKNKSNVINIDGNTIRLYKESIEVYSGQSFFADDAQKATANSFKYWNRIFRTIENDLDILIIKPRSQNIRLVNQHYAETNNELAEECERHKHKISVYATDDGKLWFKIDNSFDLHEAETLHPQAAKHDMERIKRHFNDIRDNKPPTMSEMMSLFKQQSNELSENLLAIVEGIKTINKTNNDTATGLKAIVEYVASTLPKQKPPKKEQRPVPEVRSDYFG